MKIEPLKLELQPETGEHRSNFEYLQIPHRDEFVKIEPLKLKLFGQIDKLQRCGTKQQPEVRPAVCTAATRKNSRFNAEPNYVCCWMLIVAKVPISSRIGITPNITSCRVRNLTESMETQRQQQQLQQHTNTESSGL